jgi:hypothetical protein
MQSLMFALDDLRLLAQTAAPDPALWSGDAARAYAAQVEQLVGDLAALQVQIAQLPSFRFDLAGSGLGVHAGAGAGVLGAGA